MLHKIMLVEDDLPILELMELLLGRLGYEPVLVPDVLEALVRIRTEPPDLLLLDIMMTPMNGWEVLEKVREEYGMKDLPVLIFSASPSVDEKIATLKDKNLGVLQKPVTLAELRYGIERFLGPLS
ncbi:response regulator [Methanoregula sp.]|uniref:response regulator n=1 Tax=Methanoregula sp. TaxID=2052170 RepID=UPI00356A4900